MVSLPIAKLNHAIVEFLGRGDKGRGKVICKDQDVVASVAILAMMNGPRNIERRVENDGGIKELLKPGKSRACVMSLSRFSKFHGCHHQMSELPVQVDRHKRFY
jgi:hypothetical protein